MIIIVNAFASLILPELFSAVLRIIILRNQLSTLLAWLIPCPVLHSTLFSSFLSEDIF